MGKSIAKGLFYAVVTVMLLWTASLTYSFVAGVLPKAHWAVPLFSLVVFDAGMIAWLKVFLDYAQGSGQRAVALVASLFDFLGVGLMTLAELFLGGQTIVQAPANLGEYALWGIAVWTVVNVGGVLAFHLLDPEARQRMAIQNERDAVFTESLKKLAEKRVYVSGALSEQLSESMLRQLVADLAADWDSEILPQLNQKHSETVLGNEPVPFSENGNR